MCQQDPHQRGSGGSRIRSRVLGRDFTSGPFRWRTSTRTTVLVGHIISDVIPGLEKAFDKPR